MPGVYKEVWEREVTRRLSHADQGGFVEGLEDKSQYVTNSSDEAQVIHMAYLGVNPDVLVNNTTYPIPIADQPLEDMTISLDKYQTKATPVTDDELFALSVDKMTAVKDSHAEAIAEKKYDKAIHALAPAANTAATPVLKTTGEVVDGRKRLTRADIIALKKAFDDAKVPTANRRLVLSTEHVADLLLLDQKFAEQYYNYTSGKIANLYGFEVYEYVNNPIFDTTTLAKKSFGAVPGTNDRTASVAFHTKRCVKAIGWTKMYHSEAKNDTQYQRNLVNFRHYAVFLPKRQEAIGAIVSDKAA